MNLTCCSRFQREVEALNEFQIRDRKFKPVLLSTGFTVTTGASLFKGVLAVWYICPSYTFQKQLWGYNFSIMQHKIWLVSRKAVAVFKTESHLDFIFFLKNCTFLSLLKPDSDVYWWVFSVPLAFITQFHQSTWTSYQLPITVNTKCYGAILWNVLL